MSSDSVSGTLKRTGIFWGTQFTSWKRWAWTTSTSGSVAKRVCFVAETERAHDGHVYWIVSGATRASKLSKSDTSS